MVSAAAKQRHLIVWKAIVGFLPQGTMRWLVAAGALIALTAIAYAPALRGGFVWDDDAYVSANVTLRSLDGLQRIWLEPGAVAQYYPLAYTTFWIEYRLWGSNPSGYHVVNILLHILNALLLWWALRRLRVDGAWVAAMIFAVHPVHAESVAWITERKNVLSGFFYFLSLHAWLSARPLPRDRFRATASARPLPRDRFRATASARPLPRDRFRATARRVG